MNQKHDSVQGNETQQRNKHFGRGVQQGLIHMSNPNIMNNSIRRNTSLVGNANLPPIQNPFPESTHPISNTIDTEPYHRQFIFGVHNTGGVQ